MDVAQAVTGPRKQIAERRDQMNAPRGLRGIRLLSVRFVGLGSRPGELPKWLKRYGWGGCTCFGTAVPGRLSTLDPMSRQGQANGHRYRRRRRGGELRRREAFLLSSGLTSTGESERGEPQSLSGLIT